MVTRSMKDLICSSAAGRNILKYSKTWRTHRIAFSSLSAATCCCRTPSSDGTYGRSACGARQDAGFRFCFLPQGRGRARAGAVWQPQPSPPGQARCPGCSCTPDQRQYRSKCPKCEQIQVPPTTDQILNLDRAPSESRRTFSSRGPLSPDSCLHRGWPAAGLQRIPCSCGPLIRASAAAGRRTGVSPR